MYNFFTHPDVLLFFVIINGECPSFSVQKHILVEFMVLGVLKKMSYSSFNISEYPLKSYGIHQTMEGYYDHRHVFLLR